MSYFTVFQWMIENSKLPPIPIRLLLLWHLLIHLGCWVFSLGFHVSYSLHTHSHMHTQTHTLSTSFVHIPEAPPCSGHPNSQLCWNSENLPMPCRPITEEAGGTATFPWVLWSRRQALLHSLRVIFHTSQWWGILKGFSLLGLHLSSQRVHHKHDIILDWGRGSLGRVLASHAQTLVSRSSAS